MCCSSFFCLFFGGVGWWLVPHLMTVCYWLVENRPVFLLLEVAVGAVRRLGLAPVERVGAYRVFVLVIAPIFLSEGILLLLC